MLESNYVLRYNSGMVSELFGKTINAVFKKFFLRASSILWEFRLLSFSQWSLYNSAHMMLEVTEFADKDCKFGPW